MEKEGDNLNFEQAFEGSFGGVLGRWCQQDTDYVHGVWHVYRVPSTSAFSLVIAAWVKFVFLFHIRRSFT